jgi:hypothetical protein
LAIENKKKSQKSFKNNNKKLEKDVVLKKIVISRQSKQTIDKNAILEEIVFIGIFVFRGRESISSEICRKK